MAAAPVPEGPGARGQAHPNSVSGVVGGAPHLHLLPPRPEVGTPHLRVGLEPAARQDDRGREVVAGSIVHRGAHQPPQGPGLRPELGGARPVLDRDPGALRRSVQRGDQLGALPPSFHDHPSPEPMPAVDEEGLPVVREDELDALPVEPLHRGERLGDEGAGQIRVRPGPRHALEVREQLVSGVPPDLHAARAAEGPVLNERGDVVCAPVGEAERPGRDERIPSALLDRRPFQQRHPSSALGGRQGRAQSRVPAADHDHVALAHRQGRTLRCRPERPLRCRAWWPACAILSCSTARSAGDGC